MAVYGSVWQCMADGSIWQWMAHRVGRSNEHSMKGNTATQTTSFCFAHWWPTVGLISGATVPSPDSSNWQWLTSCGTDAHCDP
jgi:hypothetical protein